MSNRGPKTPPVHGDIEWSGNWDGPIGQPALSESVGCGVQGRTTKARAEKRRQANRHGDLHEMDYEGREKIKYFFA